MSCHVDVRFCCVLHSFPVFWPTACLNQPLTNSLVARRSVRNDLFLFVRIISKCICMLTVTSLKALWGVSCLFWLFYIELAAKQVRVNSVWYVYILPCRATKKKKKICENISVLWQNKTFILKWNVFCSPGVIITEVHKRAGLNEEEYAKVLFWNWKSSLKLNVQSTFWPFFKGVVEWKTYSDLGFFNWVWNMVVPLSYVTLRKSH